MPIYLYEFNNCKTRVEVEQAIASNALITLYCPECEKNEPVTRLISSNISMRIGWRKTIYDGKGSRQSQVKEIGGKLYDSESYNAVRYGNFRGKRIRTADYRKLKKEGRLDRRFKEKW